MMFKLRNLCSICFAQNIKKIILFMFIISIYTAYRITGAIAYEANAFEFTLEMLCDFHLIIFVMLPIYGFCMFSYLPAHNSIEKIRYKSFNSYFIYRLIPIIIFAFILPVILLTFSLLFSLFVKLPITPLQTGYFDNSIVSSIITNNSYSIVNAVFSSFIYLFTGLVFVAVIINFLYHILSKKILISIIFIEYLLSVLAVQWEYDRAFPYIFLNNYLILYNAANNNCVIIQILIILSLCTLTIIAAKKRWGCANL